jgi:hypothetical protein
MGGGVLALLGSHVIDLLSFLRLGRVRAQHSSYSMLVKAAV